MQLAEYSLVACRAAAPIPPLLLPNQDRTFGTAALRLLSFEVDIWGRLCRATEAARANLLASEETRNAVVTPLVSDVATSYLTPRNSITNLKSPGGRCKLPSMIIFLVFGPV